MRRILPVTPGAAALLLAACFETADPGLQGPGSETVGLMGEAFYPPASPAIGAEVIARPADRLPAVDEGSDGDPSWRAVAVTDSAGRYRFPSLPPGPYLLEIRDAFGRAAAVPCTVTRASSAAPEAFLVPLGGMQGTVIRPRASTAPVHVRIFGLDRMATVMPGSTSFTLGNLPAGRFDVRISSPDSLAETVDLGGVAVAPDSLTPLGEIQVDAFSREDYSRWAHARRIAVRTGAAGIDSGEILRGFPLLVRLDAASFPFTEASSTGSDLRFEDAAGKHLPFEIESWSAADRQAAVWVRLDSLRAGEDFVLRMRWGRTGTRALSRGPLVFDTADGFRGVWHLQPDQGPAARYPDASFWGDHAHPEVPSAVRPAPSPLAQGIALDGELGHLAASRYQRAPQTFSLSLWFRADGPGKLLGFENTQSGRASSAYDRHLWVGPDGKLRFGVFFADPPEGSVENVRILASPSSVQDGKWHHVIALQDPVAGQSLYLDGEKIGENPLVSHAADYSGYWHLGFGSPGNWEPTLTEPHFLGDLDEVRIRHRRESPAWIKLAWLNQRPGSDLLLFLPE